MVELPGKVQCASVKGIWGRQCFKFHPMDNISPGHLDIFGSGCKGFVGLFLLGESHGTEEPGGLSESESDTAEQLTLGLYFPLSGKMRSCGWALVQHYFVLIKQEIGQRDMHTRR